MKNFLISIFSTLMIIALLCPFAAAGTAQDIVKHCNIRVSEGDIGSITDNSLKTSWFPSAFEAEIQISLPENAGYVSVDWASTPSGFIFIQYNANGEAIAATDQHESLVGICQLFHLKEGARYVSLKLTQPGQGVSKIRVYSAGDLPMSIKDFKPPLDRCDLMVVSAHQDDEWIFFGGIIPYYQYVRNKDVQVVYMANCGTTRKNEALNGLWAGGVHNHPEFIDLKDENVSSLDTALEHWGGRDNLIGVLVERIRRFQPEVILTHDYEGEYGHKQHILTSTHMAAAIMAAADPNSYPDSYAKYGAWEVKKLYIHLAKDCEIDFDWNVAYEELYGYTPLEVARKAYAQHKSQQKYYQVNDGGKYDNSRFGLTYSTVGWDEKHDDLFEHIDVMPEITAEPTPTSAPVFTPEPTPQPTPGPIIEKEKGSGTVGVIIAVIGGIAVIAAAGLYLRNKQLKHRRRSRYNKNRYHH